MFVRIRAFVADAQCQVGRSRIVLEPDEIEKGSVF